MAKKPQRGGKREGSGRKVLHPEGATIPITVRVPETLVDRVDALAEKREQNRSEIVTEAVRGFVKRHERKAGESNPSG